MTDKLAQSGFHNLPYWNAVIFGSAGSFGIQVQGKQEP